MFNIVVYRTWGSRSRASSLQAKPVARRTSAAIRAIAFHVAAIVGGFCLSAFMASDSSALQFSGSGVGEIPDGLGGGIEGGCNAATEGAALAVSFAVEGLAAPITNIGVRLSFDPPHTYVGDLHVVLAAPDGVRSAPIFGDTGNSGDGDDSSDVRGPYAFSDSLSGDWWGAAAAADEAVEIPSGEYRATSDGLTQAVSLLAAFGNLSPVQANGRWTLTIADDCIGDTGSVSAAALVINESLPVSLQSFSVD